MASIFLDVAKAPEALKKQISTLYASGPDPDKARDSIHAAFRWSAGPSGWRAS
ncbi:hypothetical protein [Streptomyces platensis]